MGPTSLGWWERTAETKERKEDWWKEAIWDRGGCIIERIIRWNLFLEKVAENIGLLSLSEIFLCFVQMKSPVFLLPTSQFCQFLLTVWCSHDASSHTVYLPRAFQAGQANHKGEIHHIIQNSCQRPVPKKLRSHIYSIFIISFYYYPCFHWRNSGPRAL